ncbi:MAG: flagellar filament capping protein FliD [Gemmatimonadales bacterium]|nr:flagellar filament capping protein FliD [Gemmatimonadales bacterium]MDZ4388972.1 flagellar filament capping protein FliD [Gemmatimonadales bacterium]
MTAPIVSFSGLASGLDTRGLVDAIIAQARVPAVRLEADQAAITQQRAALATFDGLLASLRSAAATLRLGTPFEATTATTAVVSGSGPLATVTTAAGVAPGSVRLSVDQLARAAKLSSNAVADPAAALGNAGTISINGRTLDVAADTTLTGLRDAINALNSGSTPSGVSATILGISPTEQRLVLTSAATGAAGIALADTTGTVLQSLGLVDALGNNEPGAVLQAGTDAIFRLDGFVLTRSSNVVTDAINGVTLTLTSEEVGAVTDVTFGRFADAARTALQQFTDAYNAVTGFLRAQGTATDTSRPVLFNDALLRGLRRDLPTQLLQSVLGAAPDLATAASAGLSLTREGTLQFNVATFDAAFNTRPADVRALFTETLSATGTGLSLLSSGGNPTGGTFDVEILAPATRATISSSGFSGSYDAGATADELTVRNVTTGRSVVVPLTTGMTTLAIRDAIQAAADSVGLGLDVAVSGNNLEFTAQAIGSAGSFALEFSGLGDGGSELFAGNVSASGDDVIGTIGGFLATGSGDLLVGNGDTPVAGLSVRSTSSATGIVGSVSLRVGTGASIERLLDQIVGVGGALDQRRAQLDLRSERITDRIEGIDVRLERRRNTLLGQFLRMEAAISRLQSSQSALGVLALPARDNNR